MGEGGCVGISRPAGWSGPAPAGELLLASTAKGELSALDLIPEAGPECENSTDDDEDGWVNEGCPKVEEKAESGNECANDDSDETTNEGPDDDVVNDGCPEAVPLWTFPTGDEEQEIDLEAIYGTPVVVGDTVYVAGYSGDVYALALETGEPVWSGPFEADGPIIAGLAASETAVYVASDDGMLYALDPADGSEKDRFDAGDSIWAAPLLEEGVVYVASVDGKLHALDAETLERQPKWSPPFEADQGLISDPVLIGDTVLVGGFDRKLHAVNAETAKERDGWPFKEADNWFWARPLVADGTVYAPNLDGHLYALNVETGKEVWDSPFEADDPIRSAPVIAGGVLVVVDRGGNVYGLDLAEEPEDERLLWSEALEKTVLSNPLVVGEEGDEGVDEEKVLISAQKGDHLFSVNPVTGKSTEVATP
jgi:outer membrane protein assembly factor BamB